MEAEDESVKEGTVAKTTMARLMTFEYQHSMDIFKATGGDPQKMIERAVLCKERNQAPGYALYDAIERGKLDGKTLLALATIAFVKIIQETNFGMISVDLSHLDKPFTEDELEILRQIPEEAIDQLPTEVAEKIRNELEGSCDEYGHE
jgi:hypothetical protein